MKDDKKTKKQLINELVVLREQIIEFEKSETKYKQVAEEITSQQTRIEMITQNIGAGLAIISKDFRTLWANNVLKQSFGDVKGKTCYSTYNKRTKICPKCGVQDIFAHGKDKVVHEQIGQDTAGNIVWSEIIATPIRNREGSIVAAMELVITLPQRGRLDGCEPSQRRPLRLLLKSAFFLFIFKLLLMFNVFFNLLKLKAHR